MLHSKAFFNKPVYNNLVKNAMLSAEVIFSHFERGIGQMNDILYFCIYGQIYRIPACQLG